VNKKTDCRSPRPAVPNLRDGARQYTGTALAVLAEIAVNRRCSALARVKACHELIVSGWGLPPQAVSATVEQLPPPGPAPSLKFIFVSKRPDGSDIPHAELGGTEQTTRVN
jgi:hypothetical protein